MSEHYRSHPSGIEAIEITQFESFLRGNVIKYVMRAPYKGDELADLEKAAEYLQWEIERVKEEQFWAKFEEPATENIRDKIERLELRIKEARDSWDNDYTVPFDEVVFPDKCQECNGTCKVC